MEPILDPANQRQSVYPIEAPDVWQNYKLQLASFWTAEEVDFSKDREDWRTRLSDDERHFIKRILMFFSTADTIVSLNLMRNFCNEVKMLEAQIAYTYQAMIENIHAEVYSIMIDTYIQDDDEKKSIRTELGQSECVAAKVEWVRRWSLNDETAPFATRLLAFVIVEGILFSGAFCAIYWIKRGNKLPGLTKSNEFIARDEGMHAQFGCLLYSKLTTSRLDEKSVHAMVAEAVEIERRFIVDAIPCRLLGMNSDSMVQYIQHVADRVLLMLGYSCMYNAKNPFSFMELIGMSGRSNFFEERVSNYQRSDVLNTDPSTAVMNTWDTDF